MPTAVDLARASAATAERLFARRRSSCSSRRARRTSIRRALKDRRFSTTAWQSTPAYAFTAAWYLLNARYLQELVDALDTDPKTRERIRFAVQQWTAAASPSNFLAFNPEAQKTLLESKGESLRQGVMNLLNDMQRGKISQTDESRFVVGKNIANDRRLGRVRERAAATDPVQAAHGARCSSGRC